MNDEELITLMKAPFAGVHMTVPADEVIRHGRGLRKRRRVYRLTGTVALAGGLATAVAVLPAGGQPRPGPSGHPGKTQLAAWTATRDPDGGITVVVNQMKDPEGLQATLRADGIPARVTFNPVNAMNKPLPAGCTTPKMSDEANAQLQTKILTPPAILAWQQHQQKNQQSQQKPVQFHLGQQLRVTYTKNGHPEQLKLTMQRGPYLFQKLLQLRKEGAKNIKVNGVVFFHNVGLQMPDSLQTLQEKETQDPTGRSALYINPAAIPNGIGLYVGVDVVAADNFNFGVDLVVNSPQCTGVASG
jgi:hypothetical protein